jgi:hypothetical protein
MKECFVPKRFNGKSTKLLVVINQIMEDYARDGFDLTVRQIHYVLVSKNIIRNTVKQYKSLVGLINDGRLAGVLDWGTIVDRGRNAYRLRNWANPGEMAKEMARNFMIDKWADQPYYLEVMVEKQALEGVLLPVCNELDITFMANKGYSSASAFYRAGKRFAMRAAQGKKLMVLYLGDHDPSGMDMTRDVLERVPLLGGTPMTKLTMPMPLDIQIQRLALNIDQVRKFKPPENPAKQTDSRCPKYIEQFGESSWELDAVEPRTLAQLVRDAVMKVRDEDLWLAACRKETRMRKELTKFAKTYDKKGKKKRKPRKK